MNLFEFVDSFTVTRVVGWTLLHFLWQGALIALLTGAALAVLRRRSANARYAVCCTGMVLMLLVPAVTFDVLSRTATQSMAAAAELFPLRLEAFSLWEKLIPFLPWLTLFWFLGTCSLQARLLLQWRTVQGLRRRGTSPVPPAVKQAMAELCRRLDIGQPVRLMGSSLARVPMVMGWLVPVILVPGSVLTGLGPEALRTVLAHELAHIRRHDYLVNLIQSVIEALLFYQPAVWWLSNRMRAEREYCCDDVVVQCCHDPLCYAKALASVDSLCDAGCRTAVASSGGSLMNRIFRIVGARSKSPHGMEGWLAPLAILLIMVTGLSAMSFLPVDRPDDPPSKKKIVTKYVHEGDDDVTAFKNKVKKVIDKMKSEGKSKMEIAKAVEKMEVAFEASRKKSSDPAADQKQKMEFKKKVSAVMAKMKAEGKSKKEIEKTVQKMETEFMASMKKHPSPAYADEVAFKKEVDAKVRKMKAAGKSDDEIKRFIKDAQKKFETVRKKTKGKEHDLELIKKKKTENLIKKMKASGKSDEEIKVALKQRGLIG